MLGQRRPHRLRRTHPGLFAAALQRAGHQASFDVQEFRGGPVALAQGAVGDHADRPLLEEPVRQPLQLGPVDGGQVVAEGGDHLRSGEGGRLGG
jgi:hypothetical protein